MHTAKDNYVRIRPRRCLREPQRISDKVGDFLHLVALVVVSQNDRLARGPELADAHLFLPDLLGRVIGRLDRRQDVPLFKRDSSNRRGHRRYPALAFILARRSSALQDWVSARPPRWRPRRWRRRLPSQPQRFFR